MFVLVCNVLKLPFIFKVNRLSISGGHTLKKTIWRICSKVFGPVAKQLNWCGRGEKRGIRKTNIGALLIGTSKMCSNVQCTGNTLH